MSITQKRQAFIFAIIFTFFSVLSPFQNVYAETENPIINVGVKDINVTISYTVNNEPTTEILTTNQDGKVELESLSNYIKTLNWSDSGQTPDIENDSEQDTDSENDNDNEQGIGSEGDHEQGAGTEGESEQTTVTEIPIKYEVNYPGKNPTEKDTNLNGNGHYTDVSGEVVLTPDNWQNEISAEISEIAFVQGEVVRKSKNGEETAIENGYEVKIGTNTFTTDTEGKFNGYPTLKEEDAEKMDIVVKGDDNYNDYAEKYSDFKVNYKAILTEKNTASENDYSYGNNISDNGYVKSAGEYTIKGEALALSLDGPFSDSVNVTIADNGDVSKVYVKKGDEVLKPIENIIHLDQSAPTITGIDTIKETTGDMIKFLLHGMFTNEPADITLDVTVTDNGSGVNKINLVGENKETGKKVIYEPTSTNKEGDKYNVSFKIEGDDFKVLENLLKVVAIDKVGNESDLRLVRATEVASTLVIEKIKPTISNIKVEGDKSEKEWFKSGVNVSFDVQDLESGLYNLRITLNGSDIYEKEFTDTRNVGVNNLSFNITPEMVAKYINASGSYEAFLTLTDNSGNITTLNHKVNIDLIKPNVTLSGIENDKAYKESPVLNIKNDEKHYTVDGAYVNVSVTKDGEKFDEKKYERQNDINYSNFDADGKYEITVYAVDAAGNKSDEQKVSFVKDTIKPIVKINSINGKQANGWYSEPVTVNFDSQDGFSGLKNVKATVNGATLFSQEYDNAETNNNTYSFKISKENIEKLINAAGSYDITITSEDFAGNVESIAQKIHIDIVSPEIDLSGISKTFYNNAPTLKITNNEKHYNSNGAYINVVINRDGKTVSDKNYNEENSLSINSFGQDGDYNIKVYAVDAAGNKSKVKSESFVKDAVKPSISNISTNKTKKNGWYKDPFKVDFDIKDDRSGLNIISVTLNGKEVLNNNYGGRITSTKNLSFNITEGYIKSLMNKEGTYTAVFTLSDNSGNKKKVTRRYKIDTVAPKVTISGIEKGKHYIKSPTLSVRNDEKHYSENGAYIMVIAERDGKVVSKEKYSSLSKTSFSEFGTDGNYKLTVYAVDAAGNKSGEKKISFVKDTTKPVITINGAEEGKFYASDRNINVAVNERYYKTNKVTITVTRKLNGKTYNVSFPWSNNGKRTSHSKIFTKTGTYKITVKAKDEAGNTAKSKALSFTVDTKRPEITIRGVKSKAYGKKDLVAPTITIKDDYYKSRKVTLTRNGEILKMSPEFEKNALGGKLSYKDFPMKEKYDGVYKLTVTAVDKAGNTTKKSVTFFVNRFGSVFKYNKAIIKLVAAKYVQRVPNDLIITEYNITKVKSSSDNVKHDGTTSKIKSEVKDTSDKISKVYTHKFKAFDFKKEGIYSINIVSKDGLGNIAESQKKTGKINFAVDRTAPKVILDQDIDNGLFDMEALPVKASIIDSISPASVEVVLNNKRIDNKKFNKNTGEVEFVVPEGRNNNVKINVRDLAGNEKTYKYSNITVSKNWFVRLTGNKVLYIGIGVFLAALAGSIFVLRRKKKS